jgi:hypothetical protein
MITTQERDQFDRSTMYQKGWLAAAMCWDRRMPRRAYGRWSDRDKLDRYAGFDAAVAYMLRGGDAKALLEEYQDSRAADLQRARRSRKKEAQAAARLEREQQRVVLRSERERREAVARQLRADLGGKRGIRGHYNIDPMKPRKGKAGQIPYDPMHAVDQAERDAYEDQIDRDYAAYLRQKSETV